MNIKRWDPDAGSSQSLDMDPNNLDPKHIVRGGGGQIKPRDAKISEKGLCFHHNNTDLIFKNMSV